MNLLKIIRTKFFPPITTDKFGIYSIESKNTKYRTVLTDCIDSYYPRKDFDSFFSQKEENFDIKEEYVWYNTPEEARECAWNHFDNYGSEPRHKEPG